MQRNRFSAVFRQGVGRTIFVFILAAGVVPVVFTAALAIMEIERAAEARIHETLRQNAKAYGIDILSRLISAADKAEEIAALIDADALPELDSRSYLVDEFDAIWLSSANGTRTPILGVPNESIIGGLVQYEYIAAGGTQLAISGEGSDISFVLLRLVDRDQATPSMVAFRMNSDRIWGAKEQMPYNTDFCVYLASGSELFCTRRMDPSIYRALNLTADSGVPAGGTEFGDQVAAIWQLFLAGNFEAPSFDIVATQPRAYALRSYADFRRIFLPALSLVIILVGLLSLRMIGASLGPLTRLTKAARDFADGDLDTRVSIESRDEFGALGQAFNTMAGKMGRQIDMLEAMSEIDKLILTGGSIDEVCGAVAQHLIRLTKCNAVAVVTGLDDHDSPAMMYAICGDKVFNESIDVSALSAASEASPGGESIRVETSCLGEHAQLFTAAGATHVAVVPILLQRQLKGSILIGRRDSDLLHVDQLQQCDDIAERFAVALASFKREEVLFRKANYDDLTGLPNRQLLKDRLRDLVERPDGAGNAGALLYLDLDRFKEVNDVYGHSVGDIVLVQAAERIISETRDNDIVARLGGDEFVVVMPNVSRSEVIKSTAMRLLSRLTDEFSVSGVDHYVGASIGIVVFPDDGESVETLLKNADAAMYRAKEAGRSRYEFFNHELNEEGRRKIELERGLRSALANGELELWYQPQFHLDSGALSGAEALLRWHHQVFGEISPAEFVPLAEESDLIVDIGHWVAERCARDLRSLFDDGLHPGPVAINVSARQLRDERLGRSLFQVLADNNIQPSNLRIEVTETAVAQNRDSAIDLLDGLRKKGVRIALDDFGTGYSSLSYLQNMPYDVIKIDKSFVDLINKGETSANICRTIIRMAHELGKTSIAEGVESQSQVDFLRQSGCDIVQGYFYAKPMPFDEFVAFIRKIDLHTHRRKALELV